MSLLTSCLLALLAIPLASGNPTPLAFGSGSRIQSTDTLFKLSRRTDNVTASACPVPKVEEFEADVPSPFKVFSDAELQGLAAWLHAPEQGLNLTDPASPNLTISDNYIWHIEELKPNKTDVLAFLEQGKQMPRHARVVITEGGKDVPWVTEYSVSTLLIARFSHQIVYGFPELPAGSDT